MEAIELIEMLCLLVAVSVPVIAALRGAGVARGTREPALALHRAQLRELERDRALELIASSEHAAAVLEVQRRLLRAAAEPGGNAGGNASADGTSGGRRRRRIGAGLVIGLTLLAAVGLYAWNGHPGFAPFPAALRINDDGAARDAAMAQALENSLRAMKPDAPDARQGWLLLGQVQAARGEWRAAAAAWDQALKRGFDPAVAVEEAEALARADGTVGDAAAALFRQALAAAPADAPWRTLAEARLAQHSHAEQPER